MKYTSAEAAKLLRKLNENHQAVLDKESKCADFIAAVGEDIEDVRPQYDYHKTQEELAGIEQKIRTVKHAINQFNISTVVRDFGMTVDQMLVYIPQLSARKQKLSRMAAQLPKERCSSAGFGAKTIIEYRYANYDIAQAAADYSAVLEQIASLQLEIDLANQTRTFEVEL